MPLKTRAILVLTVGSLLGLSLSLSGRIIGPPVSVSEALPVVEGRLLAEVMERVRADYVDAISDEELLEGAIRGMVSALDPHSEFLDADEYEEIRISSTGNYSGVGIEVSLEGDAVTVVAPFDDTPAQRAGIRPGDVIISVDGEAVEAGNVSDTIAMMRGRPGTTVTLGILRDGNDAPLHFSMKRAYVKVASVRHELLDDDIGYVRVSQFSETTARDLRKAVRSMRRQNEVELTGLVLDLRNNPGGVLDAAVQVSDLFLTDGTIVSANGRDSSPVFEHAARRGDILKGAPISVLVNEGSASAAEIVAGALQDNARATIIGTPTFGKGSVQTVIPLSNGNAVKLTTSRYLTPSGRSINDTGIQPDIEVYPSEMTAAATAVISRRANPALDAQLASALVQLRDPYLMHSKAP